MGIYCVPYKENITLKMTTLFNNMPISRNIEDVHRKIVSALLKSPEKMYAKSQSANRAWFMKTIGFLWPLNRGHCPRPQQNV